eukprot:9086676-Ditylum_brightwellii.AAC.1
MQFLQFKTMRASDGRPHAKPPWATSASTPHPPHIHPFNHTPTITVNQKQKQKDMHQLHHLLISIVLLNRKHQNSSSINLRMLTPLGNNNRNMHTHPTRSSHHVIY